MSYRLGTSLTKVTQRSGQDGAPDASRNGANVPLVTIACHEDLTASDLVGRFLLEGESTVWVDGPLTRAVKAGGICYLDEIVEARKDTTVLIHPLTDHRRILPVEKRGELLEAADGFLLVMSYNPGYQSALKDLKHSTRQRFVAIEFNPPPMDVETKIVQHEAGVDRGDGAAARQARPEGPQPEGARPRRGREHPAAHLRGAADHAGDRPSPRLPGRRQLGRHRRARDPGQHRGSDNLDIRVMTAVSPMRLDAQPATMAAVRRVLSASPKTTLDDPELAPAGVMLLLYPKCEDYSILLNKRSDKVDRHKGEVSFPGGRREEADASLLHTALRETQEEMGVLPDDVEVLGQLDEVATVSKYAISAYVGAIPEGYAFTPNRAEVAQIIELPVAPLIDGAYDRNETRLIDGQPVRWPSYAYDGHVVWGATARVLSRFVELMSDAADEELTWTTQTA